MEAELASVLSLLRSKGNAHKRDGMARDGIATDRAYGVTVRDIRRIAASIGSSHTLALQLWESGIHEARMLAVFTADPQQVTFRLMERWAATFTSWDITDQCCNHLFRKTPHAWRAVESWAGREEEFVRRAAFALMASMAVHVPDIDASRFTWCLSTIRDATTDRRPYVKKAVNWALRQLGKRSAVFYPAARAMAEELALSDDRTARWIGVDAARELRSDAVRKRLGLT